MVIATVELISVITRTPAKLHTAAMIMARSTSIDRVETQVAMAFGASVHPFTKITHSVSMTVIRRAGLARTWCQKNENDRSIRIFPSFTQIILLFDKIQLHLITAYGLCKVFIC